VKIRNVRGFGEVIWISVDRMAALRDGPFWLVGTAPENPLFSRLSPSV
jgi:hypothetical protein